MCIRDLQYIITSGSLLRLVTILHPCGGGVPRAVLFHVFAFVSFELGQLSKSGGSVERKKGRQRAIGGVVSVVNKVTAGLPRGTDAKP